MGACMMVLTPLQGIPLIQKGDNLSEFILEAVSRAEIEVLDGDIFVLAQKIVSKAEGRKVKSSEVDVSEEARTLAESNEMDPQFVQLILDESVEIVRARAGMMIVRHKGGFVCTNAGIDHSNVDGEEDSMLLLPENSDRSASEIRAEIEKSTKARVGVAIIDSHGRPWRYGTVGVMIGFSGLPGLVDLRGNEDIFGYVLQKTRVGAGDELAAAASLVMGQANEKIPVVHVRGFPYPLREANFEELIRTEENDLFK